MQVANADEHISLLGAPNTTVENLHNGFAWRQSELGAVMPVSNAKLPGRAVPVQRR